MGGWLHLHAVGGVCVLTRTSLLLLLTSPAPPSGKLTPEQITAGYRALKKIEDCIQAGQLGDPLVKACDEFYTRIPHSFG